MKVSSLRKKSDFLRLSEVGRKKHLTFVIIINAPSENSSTGTRVGYAVSKRLGNAVVRNRIKRRLRAGISNVISEMETENKRLNYDMLFIAKKEAMNVDFKDMMAQMKSFFERLLTSECN